MMYEWYYQSCWNKIAKTANVERFYFCHDGVKYVVRKKITEYSTQYLVMSPYSTCLIDIPINCNSNAYLVNLMTRYAYRKQGYGRKLMDFIYHFMSVEKQHITIEWSSTLDGMHLYTKLPYAIRLGNTYKFKMDILNK